MYGIEHEKDEYKLWNRSKKSYDLLFDSNYAHFVVKLRKGKRKELQELALAIGIKRNYIKKPLYGTHAYENMLSYLIDTESHAKYKYKPSSVCTIAGKAYMEHYSDFLKNGIMNGEITMDDIFGDDELKITYVLYKDMFDNAFSKKKTIDRMIEEWC